MNSFLGESCTDSLIAGCPVIPQVQIIHKSAFHTSCLGVLLFKGGTSVISLGSCSGLLHPCLCFYFFFLLI